MSKQRAIDAYAEGRACATRQDFDGMREQYQLGFEFNESALASEHEDIDLWDLRLCFLANGADAPEGLDRNELRLEALTNLVRLNPNDSDEPFCKPFSGDYGGSGGLYYELFQVLVDIGSDDDDWPETPMGKRATQAIDDAIRCRPTHEEFLREEAEELSLVLDS